MALMYRIAALCGATLSVMAVSVSAARASGPLGPAGSPITTSAYNVDLFQGPVLASARITGLAGAYVPLAESADGNPFNPASPAIRLPYSTLPTDYDLTGSFTLPASIAGTDFYNSGTKRFTYNDFVFLSGGANLQHAHWGLGATLNFQIYNLGDANLPMFSNLRLSLVTGHLLGGYGFFGDQLYAGIGVRLVALSADGTGGSMKTLLAMSGVGLEGGVVWAPHPLPLRVGVVGRTPVNGNPQPDNAIKPNTQGDTLVGSLYIPNNIVLPWEIDAGVAFQFGRRPLNVAWTDRRRITDEEVDAERRANPGAGTGQEERRKVVARILERKYEAIPREKVLVTTSLLVTGSASDAVGVESFLAQRVNRSGQSVSLTPRVGVETELVPGWVQARAGSYYEPSRFSQPSARLHGTLGFDVKFLCWSVFGLFDDWTTWRLGGVIDGARDYFGWSVSVGIWH
jgi:hypothetical protein